LKLSLDFSSEAATGNFGGINSAEEAIVWIWNPEQMRIVWANQTALRFWGEESLSEIVDKTFDPRSDIVISLNQAFQKLKNAGGVIRAVVVAVPFGLPTSLECELSLYKMYDGRDGLYIHANIQVDEQMAHADRFSEILDHAPYVISLFGEGGQFVWQNKPADYIFPPTGEEYSLTDRYGDEDMAVEVLRSTLINGFYSHSIEFNTRFGKRRYRVDLRRVHDSVTGGFAAVMFMRDVTDFVRLKQEENFLPPQEDNVVHVDIERKTIKLSNAGLLNTIGVGVISMSPDLRINYSNRAVQKMLGAYFADDSSGLLSDIFPDHLAEIKETISALINGSRSDDGVDLRLQLSESEGRSTRWFKVTFCLGEAEGQINASFVDITKLHKQSIRSAFQNRQKMRVLNNSGIGIILVCENGFIKEADPQASFLLFGDKGVQTNQSLWSYFQPHQDLQKYRDALSDGRAIYAETTIFTTTQTEKNVTISIGEVHPAAPKQRYISIQGISEQNQKLLLLAQELIAQTSHELRTPLGNILGFIDFLQTSDDIPAEKKQEYLSDIKDSGAYMSRLLNNLVDMSAERKSYNDPRKIPVNLNILCEKVMRAMTPNASSHNITLQFQGTSSAQPFIVSADEDMIREALNNIIINAILHAGSGATVMVELSQELKIIRIRDNGIGMSEAELEKAMEMFGQVHRPGMPQTTGGLGLPITKRIIEQHGWHFDIRSKPNKGTEITIRIVSR
jgi:signal transduction histidine kinase